MFKTLTDLYRLFFPERCVACGRSLSQGMRLMCPECRWELPLTGYPAVHDNPVFRKLGGLLPVAEASSLLFFIDQSRYRSLIHAFKYYGQWRLCRDAGEMLGEALRAGGLCTEVDLVVAVPLHPLRRLRRGYNQAEYIAEGVAAALGKPLSTRHLVRSRHNPAQASTRQRMQRWENVQNIFSVRRAETLAGKHILLVDDVLTTGATLVSCGEAILRDAPTARISIATFAVSAHDLFRRR